VSVTNEAISPDAITATIFLSLTNARARGEPWKALAEEFLGPTAWILRRINKARDLLVQQHKAPALRLQRMNGQVIVLLESFADALWKERGQDQRDPLLAMLAPGTPSFFFEWEVGLPPDRLDVLLDLLMEDAAVSSSAQLAQEIRALLPEYRALCEEVRALSAKIELLEKAGETIARAGHVQHSRLRRRMRSEGFDPTEVRRVFPDVPGVSISDTFS